VVPETDLVPELALATLRSGRAVLVVSRGHLVSGGERAADDALNGLQLTASSFVEGRGLQVLAIRGMADLVPQVTKVLRSELMTTTDVVTLKGREVVDPASRLVTQDSNVPLEKVDRQTRTRAESVEVNPLVRVAGLIVLVGLRDGEARNRSNIVLLENREARAQHAGSNKALEELVVQNGGEPSIRVAGDGDLEQLNELDGGFVDCMPLTKRDVVGHVPRVFLESRDHALVRALGAVLGIR
jgi:hypothetical protein